jgi:hypothetical protein
MKAAENRLARQSGWRIMRTVKIIWSSDGIKSIHQASDYKVEVMNNDQGLRGAMSLCSSKFVVITAALQKIILPLDGTSQNLLQAVQVCFWFHCATSSQAAAVLQP